ncbi:alpha-L-fucosidase, partial [Sphingobacterium sp.]|uniref:alpha-L-fucosidase n=1 Tax=Sphingobacterium sp. TaxID=341027 RepID=UPI00289DB692
GNLLLNIGPKGDGTFPAESIARLQSIGKWMSLNSEAIYGSSAWKIQGEGNLVGAEEKGTADEQTIKDAVNDATSQAVIPDIRFTTKDGFIYVFVRSPNTDVTLVKNLAAGKAKIAKITLLGSKKKMKWKQDTTALQLPTPSATDGEIPVYVYKVALAGNT